MNRRSLLSAACAAPLLGGRTARAEKTLSPLIEPLAAGKSVFCRENLVAWCIVPFDAKKRGPAARAAMLDRLGLQRLAYDWRDEHIPTFDEELETLKRHRIRLDAFWFPAALNRQAEAILAVLKRHAVRTQLWVTMGDPAPQGTDEEKGAAAVRVLQPLAEAAGSIACVLGLYNHGGWFGEPENQVRILKQLPAKNAGIVYNLHHGHAHLDRFPVLLENALPHLLALNLNGMVARGDELGKKILPLGDGDRDLGLLKTIRDSGYRGPIGLLNHRTEVDAEVGLRQNLDGLRRLLREMGDREALATLEG